MDALAAVGATGWLKQRLEWRDRGGVDARTRSRPGDGGSTSTPSTSAEDGEDEAPAVLARECIICTREEGEVDLLINISCGHYTMCVECRGAAPAEMLSSCSIGRQTVRERIIMRAN